MPNLKSFRTFNEDRSRQVVITFGRFQPPTIGHEKLISKVASLAKGNDYRIFTSQTQDAKKNPLPYGDKIKFLRKMFPKHGRMIIEDKKIRSVFDALVVLYKQKFDKVIFVVGSDRILEFKRILLKYNGVEAKHGFYDFTNGIEIVSSGDRDPDADDVSGMSASKMRGAVEDNAFDIFKKGLPKDFKDSKELFTALKSGMGITEAVAGRKHVKLDHVSEQREEFIKGELFRIGDPVKIIESNEEGFISDRGPNFVVVKTQNGEVKKWLTAVTKINK
jgi:hypothetical protein